MLKIDGSMGEGGGQVIRSSLTLSLLTGTPIQISNVRAGRKKPGLLRQHLTAARAVAQISGGELHAELRGNTLQFTPSAVRGGAYEFAIGSAGSALLVLQTVLLPLCLAEEPSRLVLEGGTHNPWAPTFDFFQRVFLPRLEEMGAKVDARLDRPGFYPAGGGRISVDIEPTPRLAPLRLLERGEVVGRRAVAKVSNLSREIARRELRAVASSLSWEDADLDIEEVRADGPGNVVTIEVRSEHVVEMFIGFGRQRANAEHVAREACDQARRYLAADVPVGRHLADQLILPLVVAGGGSFRTLAPSRHTQTQIDLVRLFEAHHGPEESSLEIGAEKEESGQWLLSVRRT